jgi:hypothetical protein
MGVFRPGLRHRQYVASACSGALLIASCAVDDRTLQGAAFTPEGGSPSVLILGPGGAGGTPATDESAGAPDGQAGAPETAPTPITRWTFDRDVDGWQPETDIDQAWSSTDVGSDPQSGSLMLTNTSQGPKGEFSSAGSAQCLPVDPDHAYDISTQIYIANDQSTGGGGFSVQFFDDDVCQGTLLDIENFLSANTGVWELGERTSSATGARSALFRLVTSKVKSDPNFVVLFDDVVLSPL